jgi:hypothetical protein
LPHCQYPKSENTAVPLQQIFKKDFSMQNSIKNITEKSGLTYSKVSPINSKVSRADTQFRFQRDLCSLERGKLCFLQQN